MGNKRRRLDCETIPEAEDRDRRFTEVGLAGWGSKRGPGHDMEVRTWDQSLAVKETKIWVKKKILRLDEKSKKGQ